MSYLVFSLSHIQLIQILRVVDRMDTVILGTARLVVLSRVWSKHVRLLYTYSFGDVDGTYDHTIKLCVDTGTTSGFTDARRKRARDKNLQMRVTKQASVVTFR
jgi:hypothetical protein